MAITGTGTEQDPFIVHSYDELKTACRGNGAYVELANDIDCNVYGENFEWHTIIGAGIYQPYYLDLKGHTIKNFKVAENECAFDLSGDGSYIRNGKILNAYLNRALGFARRRSNYGILENLSISINCASGLYPSGQLYMFDCAEINACAIYIEGIIVASNQYNAVFKAHSVNHPISNCDILVNIPEANGCCLSRGLGTSDKSLINCRVRGTFNSNFGILYHGCKNCVFDLSNKYEGTVFSQTVQDNTGIINSDKYVSSPTYVYSGLTGVTSQEIVNGDALRAKGFEVLNVVGQ